MAVTLAEVARALGPGAALQGDGALELEGLAEPQDAGARDLALAMDRRFGEALMESRAEAAVLWAGADWQGLGLKGAILVERAGAAMPALTRLFDRAPELAEGIHPGAVIAPGAEIGPGARIGAGTVIGANVRIGPDARIAPQVSIAANVRIGARALLHSGVRIEHDVEIGDDFICHANSVIGSDGFSFKKIARASRVEEMRAGIGAGGTGGTGGDAGSPAGRGSADAGAAGAGERDRWERVASLGGVVIGDEVEIGASTTIDAGTIRPTRIGSGTKIDNQVQIGHNVVIGRDCLICGDTALAGSVQVGDRVVLGGSCKVSDNLFIGDDVIAAGATVIFSNVPAGRQVWGNPAVRIDTQMAINRELRRLPRLAAQIRDFLQQNAAKSTAKREK